VRLEVFDRLADVAGEGFDLDVRVGDDIAPHLIARRRGGAAPTATDQSTGNGLY
jgi:LysR family transcriptional activator of dmlA